MLWLGDWEGRGPASLDRRLLPLRSTAAQVSRVVNACLWDVQCSCSIWRRTNRRAGNPHAASHFASYLELICCVFCTHLTYLRYLFTLHGNHAYILQLVLHVI